MVSEIVKENGLKDVIRVCLYKDFKGCGEGNVDVIVGEPMGCHMFYDGMAERII